MLSMVIGGLLIVGVLVLVVSVITGLATFSPERAADVRRAEAENQAVTEQMIRRHPEVVKMIIHRERLDRDEVYIGALIALWLGALGIIVVPSAIASTSGLPTSTQKLLGTCMLLGTTFALLAASSAPPYDDRPAWLKRLIVTWWQVRHAYLLGAGGLFAVDVGLGWFAWAIAMHGSLIGTPTGLVPPILFLAYGKKAFRFIAEYLRMDREYNEAIRRMRDDPDGEGS